MLVEAIQSALDISFASFGPRGLVLSDDQLVERLITNIPYFSIGPLGFAIATFLFTLHKSTKPALYVLASILFAFLASVLDFNQLLQRSNGSMPVKETINTLTLARELGFAVSVCARFLFFWHYAALPPQGEIILPPRQRIRALPGNAEQHSASYSQWGPFGIFLNWLHLFAVVAVGVLEILWRISTTTPFNPVYRADSILQIVLSALFSIKLLANVWLSPLSPRRKTLRNYLPVLVAIWIGAGVAIGNLIVFKFSDMSLGRFLQAIELYVLALLILITAGSKRADRTSLIVEDTNAARPRSTFLGPPQHGRVGSGFRISPPTISTPDLANEPPARPAAPSRMSTAERLASWLSQRIAVVKADREQDRLWNRNDIEAMGVADEKRRSVTSYSEQSPLEPQQVVPWASSLGPKSVAPSILVAKTSDLPRQPAATAAPDVSNRTSLRPPSPVFRVTTDYSRNESRSNNRPDSVTRGESPIYGLNTPPPRMIGQSIKELYSPSLESLMREQERLDKSVANLKLLSPSPGTGQTPGIDLAPPTTTARTESESYRSEFSLSNFPSPPAAAFFTKGSSIRTYSDSRSGSGESAPEVPSRPPLNAQPQNAKEDVVMDDVTFTLIPPRMPVAMEEGRQSVPSTSGGSLPEFMDSLGSNRGDSSVTQYNVTSFIGDLSSPRAGGYPSSIITGLAEVPHSPSPPPLMTAGEYFDKISKSLGKGVAPSLSPQQTLSPITPALTSATTISPIERPRAALKLNTSLPSNPRANVDSPKVAGNPRYIPFSAGRPRLDISSPISRNSRNEPLNSFERPRPAPLVLTLAKPGQGVPDTGKFI